MKRKEQHLSVDLYRDAVTFCWHVKVRMDRAEGRHSWDSYDRGFPTHTEAELFVDWLWEYYQEANEAGRWLTPQELRYFDEPPPHPTMDDLMHGRAPKPK